MDRDPRLIIYHDLMPTLAAGVFIADTARIIGDVHLGEGANVWFGAVLRGDVHRIRIGARTNLQDLVTVHVTSGRWPTTVGEDVTVGHRAVLHGCTIGDRALIGMGAVVMDGAVIGEEAIVGAGALVTPGTVIAPRTLAVGSPARDKRPLSGEEIASLRASAEHYVALAAEYRAAGHGGVG